MSSTDSVASGLWLSHVSPQHSEQLWSQAAPSTHHHHHHATQQKDQEFASALSAFQAAVAPENRSPPGLRSAATSATTVPTTTTTPPPPPMVSATGQQQQQLNAPSLPSPVPQLLQGFNGGLVGIVPPTLVAQPNGSINMVQPQVVPMPQQQQQQPAQAPQQQQQQPFFVQFLGYLPDGRPMFVPAPAVMAAHTPQQLVQAPTPGLQVPLQPVVVPNGTTMQLPLTSAAAPSLAVSHQNVAVLNNTYQQQQQQQQSTMQAPKPQPLPMVGVALADVPSPPKPKEAAADKPSTAPAPPPVVVRQPTAATPLSVPVVVTTPLSRPLVQSTVTVIGGNAPTSNTAPAVVSAVKGLRPTPLSGVNGVGATPPAAAPASSTPAAMGASGGITVRVGVTAAETPTPVTVTVGQTPTAAHHPKPTPVAAAAANVANAAASPSVVVGQRPAAATGGALTPAVSVRVGVTPSKASPATTPVSVRVGAAAGGNLASAVASMPLSKKPDAPGSHENSAAASPLATVGEARSDATPATAAPAVVNSLAGNRPPVLNASSPTAAIVQRAVLDGMTPTVTPTNSVRRGRTSQLPTPLGALQSPSVRVGLVPLTSVTVGARPTPTAAAMSVTVAGMTVPSLAPPVGGKPPALVVAPPRLQESSDTAAAAQESDAWARFEASSTLRSAVPPPLLSVAVPVSLKPSHLDNGALGSASQHKLTPHESSMRDHHRRRDGSNTAVSPHRSVSEVASRQAAEPSPPHHDASRSSSTTTSTVSSLPWKPAYKTRLCRSWMSAASSCKYGSKCMFAHGEAELVVVREAAQATDAAAGRDQGSRGSSQSDSSSRRYVGVQAMHMDAHGAAR